MPHNESNEWAAGESARPSESESNIQESRWGRFETRRQPERSKFSFDRVSLARGTADRTPFRAIVRVSKAGYVPSGVEVRARLSPELFTATVDPHAVSGIERDPLVISVEAAQSLRSFSK